MKNKILTIIILSILSTNIFALAQVSLGGEISLSTNPKNPNPGESYTATIESFAVDLDKSDISWIINNQVVTKGFGKKEVILRAPATGGSYKLDITATTPEGKSYKFSETFLAASVDIIWEAIDSYVPEWYEGRALIPEGGTVRIFAIPNISGGDIASKDIVFKWFVNDEIIEKSSGLGKSYMDYKIQEEMGDNINIELDVSAKNSSDTIVKRFTLSPKSPELIVYKSSPLYGTLSQEAFTGKKNMTEKEFSLVAEPFFTSARQSFKDLSIYWNINDIPSTGIDSFKKLFRLASSTKGISKIEAKIENGKKLLQDASTNFTLSF